MKLNIFAKLFLAVLIATIVVILFMVIFMNWSFRQGFAEYQNQSDLARINVLSNTLAREYRQQNDWNFLRNNPRGWQGMLLKLGEASSIRSISKRIRLRDNNGLLVSGTEPIKAIEYERINITVSRDIVGWLELDKQKIVTDEIANSFMEQQATNIYLIALFAMLLSLLIALVVVRQFLNPVKKLIAGAHSLSRGNFSTQIAVNSNDELGELAERFNQLADFLQRDEELRSQWIADISHELRTPIAILRSEIEAMLDGIRKPDLDRIRSLHADTLSLGQLVDDLYQLSLSDAGDIELTDETVDLSILLADLLDVFATRLQEKNISLINRVEINQPIIIRGDDNRLHQLFSNLLENSYRYTDEGGVVQVSARLQYQQQQCQIIVADSSPGVPDEALPRLFDRLFRVDKSRSRVLGGSGLGLSICKNIVKIHQGQISAGHSELGGLAINLSFPLNELPETAKIAKNSSAKDDLDTKQGSD